jgi:hypothetical protein
MVSKSRLLVVAGVLVLLGLTVPSTLRADDCGSTVGNLVANCGFESGTLSGWNFVPSSSGSLLIVGTATPHSGTYAAAFGANCCSDDYIYQNLTTTPGGTYDISFWLYVGSDSNGFNVSWEGTPIYSNINNGFVYTELSFVETATGSSTTLEFGGYNPPSWSYLDDVSVVEVAPVPEPSTMLLLGFGVMGLGGLTKRKNFV